MSAVSFSDSPFSTDEPLDLIESVSADSRFAASSNDVEVRVDDSKKTLTTSRPRRVGSFLLSRSCESANECGRREQALDVPAVEVGDREQVRAGPARAGGSKARPGTDVAVICRSSQASAAHIPSSASPTSTTRSTSSISSSCTWTRSSRAVGRFLPT